jgi:hypothetical protein
MAEFYKNNGHGNMSFDRYLLILENDPNCLYAYFDLDDILEQMCDE